MVSGIEKLALRGQAMLGAGAAGPVGGPRRPTSLSLTHPHTHTPTHLHTHPRTHTHTHTHTHTQAMSGAGAAGPVGGPRRPTRRSSAATALRYPPVNLPPTCQLIDLQLITHMSTYRQSTYHACVNWSIVHTIDAVRIHRVASGYMRSCMRSCLRAVGESAPTCQPVINPPSTYPRSNGPHLEGYLAHKKHHPTVGLHLGSHRGLGRGGGVLTSEVPVYQLNKCPYL